MLLFASFGFLLYFCLLCFFFLFLMNIDMAETLYLVVTLRDNLNAQFKKQIVNDNY